MLSLLLDRSGDPRRRAALASFLLLACFGCEASLRAQVPPSWMPSPQPTARAYHKLAFDTARQRLVMFGGSSPGLPACHDETWERQATDWQRVPTSSPPPGRCDHAMAYDPVRRNTVVFGGSTSIGPLGDTWTWDGVEWAHIPAGPAPSPRYWHAMAWDAARSKVLLFGGWAGGGAPSFGDTWEWDGSRWQQLHPSTSPPARLGHAMAYDETSSRVLLFGGATSSGYAADTWAWDGSDWILLRPPVSPSPRAFSQLASDASRRKLVLLGGDGSSGPGDSTWEWDGSQWQAMPSATAGPFSRPVAIAYDASRQRVVQIGSFLSGGEIVPGTWEWDGVDWRALTSDVLPTPRAYHAMTHDPVRQRTVMFGGSSGSTEIADTWEWDGVRWLHRAPPFSPPARSGHAMAFDALRRRVLLFGGNALGDLWEWDGGTWSQLSVAPGPVGRWNHAMAFDRWRGRLVVFGGEDVMGPFGPLGDTWEWDGTRWIQLQPTPAPPAGDAVAAFDERRGRTVLLSSGPDTWEWDGVSWTAQVSAARPWRNCSLTYDASRGRVLAFGGQSCDAFGNCSYDDTTWEWDGASWQRLQPLVSAGARSSSALAYDSRAERAVLFGGTVYGSRNSAALILGDTQIFGALVPASVRTFGAPCSGIAVPPVLTSGAPSIGTSRLRLDLVRAPAFAACAFGFSVSAQSLAFGNCTLYLGAPITILPGLTHAEGFATTSVDVPFEPALRGQVVHAQAFVVDALHAPLGVSFTAPLQCLVGD